MSDCRRPVEPRLRVIESTAVAQSGFFSPQFLGDRFFRDLTEKRLRRGVFRDVEELIMAILAYIDEYNRAPKPFVWTAKASDILEKVKRARKSLNNRHSA